jgi:hypothetical protein
MRGQRQQSSGWSEDEGDSTYGTYGTYGTYSDTSDYGYGDDDQYAGASDTGYPGWEDDDESGLMLQPEHSLVGVSNTVTHHGVPLLSYTRTMNRFYTTRKQRLSLGRFKCEVCGDRIRWWAWETGTGTRTHDGCYERLAWTWTNLYAQQQRLASQGLFE